MAHEKHGIDFGIIGIWIGITAVVVVLIAVAFVNLFTGERGDDITWVG